LVTREIKIPDDYLGEKILSLWHIDNEDTKLYSNKFECYLHLVLGMPEKSDEYAEVNNRALFFNECHKGDTIIIEFEDKSA
jgi:hypothetical protein